MQFRIILAAVALSFASAANARPAPQMVMLPTGSELATWTLPADAPVHKTSVIFVHGGPGMYTTDGVLVKGAPLRAAGFNTVYYDQAGGGQSKRIPATGYTIERAVADLEALRIALKQEKLILWGSSYGASLATIYAARYPDRVSAVILTSPGSYPGTKAKHDYKVTNRGKVDYSKALSSAVGKIDGDGANAEAKISQEAAGLLFDTLTNADLMGGMVCKGATLKAPPPGTGANLFANRMISKDLDKLKFKPAAAFKIPALILRGSCDFLPANNAASFAKLFATTVIDIPNSGHGMLENREAVDAAFSAFSSGPLAKVE